MAKPNYEFAKRQKEMKKKKKQEEKRQRKFAKSHEPSTSPDTENQPAS